MSLSVVDRRNLLTPELRELLDRRLRYALSRFDSRVRRQNVVFEDINGPRGGVDKQCRITVQLDRARDVIVKEQDAELSACITRAAERAGRAVARAIERSQYDRPRQSFDTGTVQ